jgi:HSP20 family protein
MMRRFADEMDRMFDRMFEGFGLSSMERSGLWGSGERFSPGVEIRERDGKILISADLPGMNKDDVKVDISDDAVTIEGERKQEREEREEGFYRSERSYGQFRRVIPLPEGARTDNATATFRNGVLEIVIEAPQTAKNRRRIQIQGDEGGPKPGQTAA